MQRVNEIRRKRDDPPDVATKVRKVAQLLINNDILFLLSLTNPNIKRILPKPFAHLRQTDFRSTSLKVEHSYSFDISLKFHINLRSLCIKNASVVHFRAMEGKELDVLVLDSISRLDFSEEPKISVSKLVLRNIKISLGDFSCMLNMLAPTSLQLVNTHLRERSNDAVYQALSRIVLLDLWNVETVDSFIDIDKFLYLVREKRLNKFSFASGDKILSYSCVARSLSHLVLKGVDGRTIKSISNWIGEVDVLVIKSQQSLVGISTITTKGTRYLLLEDLSICPQLLRKLGRVVSVVLRRCSFENLCFYEFIDLFHGSLRYLSLKSIEMPLDCVAYIKKRLRDCKIEFNNNPLFYASENTPNKT